MGQLKILITMDEKGKSHTEAIMEKIPTVLIPRVLMELEFVLNGWKNKYHRDGKKGNIVFNQ